MTDIIDMIFSTEEANIIRASIRTMADNMARIDVFTNGDESASYTTQHGVEVPSIRRFLAEMKGKS